MGRVSGYGISGLLAAVLCAISYYLIQENHCDVVEPVKHVQTLHVICAVAGLVLFVLSLLNFAGRISSITLLFYVTVIGLAVLGGLLVYAAVLVFQNPCGIVNAGLGRVKQLVGGEHNIFSENDGKMIAVFIMDIVSALLYFSSTGSFYRAF